jgi:D-psicose/D-tagatose/L-ribulose 3-epimerase
MRYGVHAGLWMERWTDDLAPIVATVAELGFDGVEVSLLGMTEERAAAAGRLTREAGLLVTCSDGLPREADVTSEDAAIRASGLDHLRRAVRLAAAMGAQSLAGVTYAPWGPSSLGARQIGWPARLKCWDSSTVTCGSTG